MDWLLLVLRAATGAPLTTLWGTAPDGLLRATGRRWGITPAAAHEWLCPALGCRCAALAAAPGAAA